MLRTEAYYCPACQVYRHHDGRVEFVHRLAVLQTVGQGVPALWGVEPQQPGEQEAAASVRLLRQTHARHHHFADVLTLDAHYAQAPVMEEIRRLGPHSVIRRKDERYEVVKDAAGLRRGQRCHGAFPTQIGSTQVEVRLWDTPGLTSWEGLREPIRVVYAEKELSWCEVKGDTAWECKALRILEVATTLSPAEASARLVWEIARARWGVENEGFRDLKGQWHLNHGFLHHPTGMAVLWALLAAGFNLVQLFLTPPHPPAERCRRDGPGVRPAAAGGVRARAASLEPSFFDTGRRSRRRVGEAIRASLGAMPAGSPEAGSRPRFFSPSAPGHLVGWQTLPGKYWRDLWWKPGRS